MTNKATMIFGGSLFLLLAGCSERAQTPAPASAAPETRMVLKSPAFADGQPIPGEYTCHGRDFSPPLQWSGTPSRAKSIALTCEDPDAPGGTFTHWVIFNVPATATGFSENVSKAAPLPDGSRQGKNSFGNIGYGGPCPPGGKAHHYIFRVYALDAALSLDSGAGREDLINAMSGHVLAQGQLTGTYQD
ncbi:MAG: YbhB/YbcL family Raf kinase inhibitor-like protein [Limisphaerales bacterium]